MPNPLPSPSTVLSPYLESGAVPGLVWAVARGDDVRVETSVRSLARVAAPRAGRRCRGYEVPCPHSGVQVDASQGGGEAERGVAPEHEESTVGITCVAAPVFDGDGPAVAAISIKLRGGRADSARRPGTRRGGSLAA
jgi:hypothetical protein